MSPTATVSVPGPCIYPDNDGKPMADNTTQLRWIVVLYGNLSALFADRPEVFVGADLLWYPVEGHPEVRIAPDALVAFGRPKGDRGSYKQWEEGGIPLTVVFEVLSPNNSFLEMIDKHAFYEEHGVEEYYVYDPDNERLFVYVRRGELLLRVRPASGFVSPRLGIRFDLSGGEMVVYRPDGERFLTFEEVRKNMDEARRQADEARRQADEARRQADEARHRADRLAELGRKARRGQASAEELQELERLEQLPPDAAP